MSDLDDLYNDLSDFAAPKPKRAQYSACEERVIAGFEDILKFYEDHGHLPHHGEHNDIFERLYAVRLDRLRAQSEFHNLLAKLDIHNWLRVNDDTFEDSTDDLDELANDLQDITDKQSDITTLRNVKSREERRVAEEIASRDICEDFEKFESLFIQVEADIKSGVSETRPFVRDLGLMKSDITVGQFFILNGQMIYIENIGDIIKSEDGTTDARLRVIYANGTENNLLLRSLQRALYKDEMGRRVTESNAGPLFQEAVGSEGRESGTIYVLRSHSNHPDILNHREVIHKIGVTSGSVKTRVSNAKREPTYLLADVEIIQTYKLFNINRRRLESLLQKIFANARFDIEIEDSLGHIIRPREWFLVPFHVIDEAVERIKDGSITSYIYDPIIGKLVVR